MSLVRIDKTGTGMLNNRFQRILKTILNLSISQLDTLSTTDFHNLSLKSFVV